MKAAGSKQGDFDMTCSVFRLRQKHRQSGEASRPVTTCPGIIPFGSTAGLPFLWLASVQRGANSCKMQILFVSPMYEEFYVCKARISRYEEGTDIYTYIVFQH